MITKNYKLYGRDGHRQEVSFLTSCEYETWDAKGNQILLTILNADLTGCYDYSIVSVTANSEEECRRVLDAQISDGVFKNYHVGRVEEL